MDLRHTVHRLLGLAGSSAPAGPAASADARSGPAVPAARPRPAWRDAAPTRRASGPPPLVAQHRPHEPGLEAGHATSLALQPLGHDVGLGAPPGLIAVGHPDHGATGAGAGPTTTAVPASVRPLQRRRHDPERQAGVAADDRAGIDVPASASWPTPATPGPAAALPVTPVVARLPDRLDQAPKAPPVPAGRIGRGAASGASAQAATSTTLPAVPIVARTAEAGAPVPTQANTEPSSDRITVAREDADGATGVVRPRRIRLGPALGAEVMRSAMTSSSTGPTAKSAAPGAPLPPPASVAGARGNRAGAADAGPESATPIAAAAADAPMPGPGTADPSTAHGAEPVVVARLADSSDRARAPLVGTLRPSLEPGDTAVAVGHRAAIRDDPGDGPETGGPSAALAALARVDPFGPPGTGAAAGVPTGTAGPSPVQRHGPVPAGAAQIHGRPAGGTGRGPASMSPAAPTIGRSPSPGAAGRPGAASAIVQRSGQRSFTEPADPTTPSQPAGLRLGAALPAPRAPHAGPRPSHDADRATAEAFLVARVADSGVGAAPAAATPSGAAHADDPVDGGGGHWAAGPSVQRQAGGASAVGAGAGAPGAAGASAAGAATAVGPEPTERDLDVLAGRLYDRIGQRLRRELLVDRERAGVLIDLGH